MAEEKTLTGYPSIDRPWLKYYPEKKINADLPQSSIYEYMYDNNRDYPDDIAICYFTRNITYGELFAHIDECAKALTALGVKPGEIVTVALPSIPEALYVVYALNKIGAVANMIHPLAGEKEILFYINEVESRVAVLFDGTYRIVKDSVGQTKLERAVVVTAGESLPFGLKLLYTLKAGWPKMAGPLFVSWQNFIKGGRNTPIPAVKKDSASVAIISHTGGTTGEPKGVMCSDAGCNALMWQLLCNFEFDRQECSLCVLPPFINYSLIESVMAMLAVGFKVAMIPKYEPMHFVKYIKQYRPNQVLSIPAYWEALLRIEDAENTDMSCLKHIYSGGEKMDLAVESDLNSLLHHCGVRTRLFNCMGSTEMIAGATILYDSCYKNGSVGIPMVKVGCKIVEPGSEKELPYGTEGEICFSGATMMTGFYKKPDATNEVIRIHQDGEKWLHTGDLGYIDEDGAIFVTGRIKRIFMTKGRDGNITKVFPDRIENVVSQHEAVALCCVISVPDEARINYPVVFVVLKPGTWEEEQVTEEILAMCRQELPQYMVPEKIVYRDDLPRTPRGKIDYRALEAQEKAQ